MAALVAAAVLAAVAAAPAHAGATITGTVSGDDWSLPAGPPPAANSGFFSEADVVADDPRAGLRGFDLTWRQLQPAGPGTFDRDATGRAEGMDLPSFGTQIASARPFWMRLFASGTAWAPAWLARACRYTTVGPDYEGQRHVPIWDPCVWDKLRAMWRRLMIGENLRADPRLRFVYVPGAFTYAEFDYDMIDKGGLSFDAYRAWHAQMVRDLVAIMDGENADPSDDYAYKLVYTGEDHPFSERYGDRVALFARDAVAAGMGIRNGITELFNFHLGDVPAYGTTIGADGHLRTDDGWVLFDGRRVAATENECYTACGFHAEDPRYAVKLSNLKALQLRMNWIYVVPQDSFFGPLAAHWAWVRRELGATAQTAPDAWVALRDAEDTYWKDRSGRRWKGIPYVRNLERWIVQRDVAPDGIARKGTLVRQDDPAKDNGRSYETLRTDVARGRRRILLDVDERFRGAAVRGPLDLKVTYRDAPRTRWRVDYRAAGGVTRATPAVRGRARGGGRMRTVTFRITDAAFDGGLPGGTDLALRAVSGDLEAGFVRIVKPAP